MEQLSLSSDQQHKVQEFRLILNDCALYSGVGIICDEVNVWKPVEPHLSSLDYKIISEFPVDIKTINSFATIAQSIAYPKPHASPTVAESSDSPPFVIAVFVSGTVSSRPHNPYTTTYGEVNIVDDIIQPFLPHSAPHLQHIPKLFFINIIGWHLEFSQIALPQFPEDPDGKYCIVYHVANGFYLPMEWK